MKRKEAQIRNLLNKQSTHRLMMVYVIIIYYDVYIYIIYVCVCVKYIYIHTFLQVGIRFGDDRMDPGFNREDLKP